MERPSAFDRTRQWRLVEDPPVDLIRFAVLRKAALSTDRDILVSSHSIVACSCQRLRSTTSDGLRLQLPPSAPNDRGIRTVKAIRISWIQLGKLRRYKRGPSLTLDRLTDDNERSSPVGS